MSVSLVKTERPMRFVGAEAVREWCEKKGIAVSPHGRLNASAVDAFNKAHRLARKEYRPQPPRSQHVVTIVGKKADRRGYNRKVTVTANPAKIRTWARAAGFPVGTRGRLSPEVMEAYANREANFARA